MRNQHVRSLLALLPLTLPACLSEEPPTLGDTAQAMTGQTLGKPAVAPIGGFEIRADRIIYVGYDGAAYRAYELDESLAMMRQSPGVAATQAPVVQNLATDSTHVLFGNAAGNKRLSLAGGAPASFDPWGVFGKSLRGNGGVTLRDGTLARLITGNGFGLGVSAPMEVFSGSQPTAAAVLSEDTRAYVVPAGSYLRLVNLAKAGTATTSYTCKLGAYQAYATKTLTSAHDQKAGEFQIAAKLTDGRLAVCKRSATGTSVKIVDLPFDVGDLAFEGGGGLGFEGGGGLGFEGGGGLGIWVTSLDTPEIAYISPAGKVLVSSTGGKTSITPIPIPRVVRSLSDGSAVVLFSNGTFSRIALW